MGKWYDENWNEISEEEMLISVYPIQVPTSEEEYDERKHAEILLGEGTGSGPAKVWARKLLRAYKIVDMLRYEEL